MIFARDVAVGLQSRDVEIFSPPAGTSILEPVGLFTPSVFSVLILILSLLRGIYTGGAIVSLHIQLFPRQLDSDMASLEPGCIPSGTVRIENSGMKTNAFVRWKSLKWSFRR
jgi:hypothetical protein